MEKFKIAQSAIEDKAKMYRPLSKYKNNLQFNSLPYEIEQMKSDLTLKEKRDRWHESLSRDIYVEEAINVLDDLQNKSVAKKNISSKLKKDNLVKS
jgi:carboxyl-terminal processing protease